MENPPANPDRDEVVLPDTGGWISGPCVDAEPVAAQDVEVGDTLLLEDGIRAELTDVRFGYYQFPEGRGQGVAIGWRCGSASGLLFRRASDMLTRVADDRSD
jgi:hypothetical protein